MTSNCRLSDLVFRKKHSGRRGYLVPFLVAILLLLGAQPFGAMAQSDIEQNALALKQTLDQLNALYKWLTEAEHQNNQLQSQLREQDTKIAALTKNTRAAEIELSEANKALNQSTQEIGELKALQQAQSKAV